MAKAIRESASAGEQARVAKATGCSNSVSGSVWESTAPMGVEFASLKDLPDFKAGVNAPEEQARASCYYHHPEKTPSNLISNTRPITISTVLGLATAGTKQHIKQWRPPLGNEYLRLFLDSLSNTPPKVSCINTTAVVK